MYSTTTTTEQHTPRSHINVVRLIQPTAPHQLRLSTRIILHIISFSHTPTFGSHTHTTSRHQSQSRRRKMHHRESGYYTIYVDPYKDM